MKIFFLAAGLLVGFAGLSQTTIDKHYKVYNTRTKQLTTPEQIAADCKDVDVLFFGEDHNDSAGHYLEHVIFRALDTIYPGKIVLSLEMFETDNQVALNDYLNGFIPEDRFTKDARLWGNYKDYRPMIEYAKQNSRPVIAANPPRRYVSMVTRLGRRSVETLSKEARKFLPPLPYDTLAGRYRDKFMEIMKGTPGSTGANIYYSQSLWDAGMSWSIYQYWRKNKDKKIFHCVGRFHCDEKLGTLAQLQKRKPGLKILNISCFSDSSFANPDWEKFSNLGDYIIMTDPGLKKTF